MYTTDQRAKLKTMSAEEKAQILCRKCGEYFHTASSCTRTGRLCYNCNEYGHISKDCKKKKGNDTMIYNFTDLSVNKFRKITMLTDSDASHHLVHDRDLLTNYISSSSPKLVSTAILSNEEIDASSIGEGDIHLLLHFDNEFTPITLHHVQHTPQLSDHILSVHEFNLQCSTFFHLDINSGYIYSRTPKKKISLLKIERNLYQIEVSINERINYNFSYYSHNENPNVLNKNKDKDDSLFIHVIRQQSTKRNKQRKTKRHLTPAKIELLRNEGELWHKRMGHISSECVNHLRNAAEGVNDLISISSISNCKECAEAKLRRKSFKKDRERAKRVGEVVHTDTVGPIQPPTFYSKKQYIHTMIDDYSRYVQIFLLKNRTEIPNMINEGYLFLRAKFPNPGQFHLLRCDNAPELLSSVTEKILEKYDVRTDPAEPYCHQHNGLVERVQQTIPQRARALLFESGMPENMWGFAVETACWLYNRTPHSSLNFKTPYEKFYDKKPDLSSIKLFGSQVHVFQETVPSGRKFAKKSKICYLVGFTNTGYKVYDPNTKKVEPACNVVIHENRLYKDDFPNNNNKTNEQELFSDIDRTSIPCTCPNPDSTFNKVDTEPSVSNVSSTGGGENSNSLTSIPVNLHDNDVSASYTETLETIVEKEIEYDWDSINVNKLSIRYDRFGEYDPNVFTAHQNQQISYHEAITGPL